MPFKSQAQRRWMYENDPDMAKRWEAETPNKELPDKVRKKARRKALQQLKDQMGKV